MLLSQYEKLGLRYGFAPTVGNIFIRPGVWYHKFFGKTFIHYWFLLEVASNPPFEQFDISQMWISDKPRYPVQARQYGIDNDIVIGNNRISKYVWEASHRYCGPVCKTSNYRANEVET